MPLLTWKYTGHESEDPNNPRISYMHIHCDPAIGGSETFGLSTSGYIQRSIGTQLVASAYWQDLDADTVEAFSDYCQLHLMPSFERCNEEAEDAAKARVVSLRQGVLDDITPESWQKYFSQWKAEKKDIAAATTQGIPSYTVQKASCGRERMGLTKNDYERLCAIDLGDHDGHIDIVKRRGGMD